MRPGGETGHVFRVLAGKAEYGADAMGRVIHGRQTRPISWPAVHVLLMTGLKELDLPELTGLIQLLHEEELPAVDDRFHHHVPRARSSSVTRMISKRSSDGGGHRHGAGHMLSSAQGFERLGGVIGNRGIDVNRVDLRIAEHVIVIQVALGHSVTVSARVQTRPVPAANRRHFGIGVPLINGNKLRTEPESGDTDSDFPFAHSL